MPQINKAFIERRSQSKCIFEALKTEIMSRNLPWGANSNQLIGQFCPSVFVSSVSASVSLVRAKVGWYVLFLAKVVRLCVLVCDVGKPIALLLSAIQCTAKGRLLLESISVSGTSPSYKESKFILSPNSKIWSTFSAVQWQQLNKLTEEPSLSNKKADRLMKQHCRPPSR